MRQWKEGSFCQDENYWYAVDDDLRYAAEESLNFVKLELRQDVEEDLIKSIKWKLEIKRFILKCFGKICLIKVVILKMKM
jgi:hypothetical protein